MHFPKELVLQREILAIQLLGDVNRNAHLERIPGDALVVADRTSQYPRMIEILWQDRRYIAFEHDLQERAMSAQQPKPIRIAH